MMRIETVDLHHQVLTAWASYRSTLAEAPAVVTFDHHTDTLPAFGRAAADEAERRKWIAAVDFREPAAVKAAISRLCHDEHLDLAVKAGIASRSIVVAHADHPGCADSRIQVTADASWPDLNLLTQQKISGVACSGKTQVLAFRAINALKRTGGDVLILTYNITLANYLKYRLSEIREDFSWKKIDIYPYHQFFRIRASECQLHVGFDSYNDHDFFNNASDHKKYSAIFIDEVQDYTTEWLRIIVQNFLLEQNGELVVFGDPKQNLYNRPLDTNGDIR